MPTIVTALVHELDPYFDQLERALRGHAVRSGNLTALERASETLAVIRGAGEILGIQGLVTIAGMLDAGLETARSRPSAATPQVAQHLEGLVRAMRAVTRAQAEGRRVEPAIEQAETLYAALLRDAGLDTRSAGPDIADDQQPANAPVPTSDDLAGDALPADAVNAAEPVPPADEHVPSVDEHLEQAGQDEPVSAGAATAVESVPVDAPEAVAVALDAPDPAAPDEESVAAAHDRDPAAFAPAASAVLPTLSEHLRVLAKSPGNMAVIAEVRDDMRALASVAARTGYDVVVQVGMAVVDLLDAHITTGQPVDRRTFELVLVCRRFVPSVMDHLDDPEAFAGLAQSVDRRAELLAQELLAVGQPTQVGGGGYTQSIADSVSSDDEAPTERPAADEAVDEVEWSIDAMSSVGPVDVQPAAKAQHGEAAPSDGFLMECAAYLDAMEQAVNDLAAACDPALSLGELMRITHTLKGAAAVAGCDGVTARCHALEDRLTAELGDDDARAALIDHVRAAIDEIAQLAGDWTIATQPASLPVADAAAASVALPPAEACPDPQEEAEVPDPIVIGAGKRNDRDDRPRRLAAVLEDLSITADRAERAARVLSSRVIERTDAAGPAVAHGKNGANGHDNAEQDAPEWVEARLQTSDEQLGRVIHEIGADIRAATSEIRLLWSELDGVATRQQHTLELLLTQLEAMGMAPFDTIAPRLQMAVRAAARARGKTVQLTIEGGDLHLARETLDALVDPLAHLLRNAVDHGFQSGEDRVASGKPEHGMIVVRALQDGGHVAIDVANDGAGIAGDGVVESARRAGWGLADERLSQTDALRMIFAPGFSTRDAADTLSGRGVGLDAARVAVERLQGVLSVETTPGEGTTFHIRLPLRQAPDASASPLSPTILTAPELDPESPPHLTQAGRDGESRRVALVVDDSLSVRRVLGRALERRGWATRQARDGVEALELLAAGSVDVVVTDLEMPRMDGYELVKAIRSRAETAELPIVVLTSRSAGQHVDTSLELGAAAYLVKPFREQTLFAALEQAVAVQP